MVTPTTGAAGTAGGGNQSNTTGGGAGGGAATFNFPGVAPGSASANGGPGGRTTSQYTAGQAGAPVPGQTITIIVGAGGAAKVGSCSFGAANPGSPGNVSISWS